MHFKDESKYTYELPFEINEVRNIGWLEKEFAYEMGETSAGFIEKLSQIIGTAEVNATRGIHHCTLCDDGEDQYLKLNGRNILLGMAEIWVPSVNADSIIFASPTLIYHYIKTHKYKPPEQFIKSVGSFSIPADWNGQEEYEKLISKYFTAFNKR